MPRRRAAGLSRPPAEAAPRLADARVVVARLVAVILTYLAVLGGLLLLLVAMGYSLIPDPAKGIYALVGLGLAEGGALGSVLLLWHLLDKQPISRLGLAPAGAGRRWLRGAAAAVLMMGFIVLAWYTLVDGASWDTNDDLASAGLALVVGFGAFLLQGPAEEVLFRGYVLEEVRGRWGLGWGIGVSAASFALLHAANSSFGLLPLVNLVLFGVATALYKVYVDGGQLWGVFAIHTLWNWLQQVVFGLPNSGSLPAANTTLFNVQPNMDLPGPIWGAGFGPEGTLAATLVLLALLGVGLRSRRRCARGGGGG